MESQESVYLRDEYLFLQNQYENFDQRSLTIKGWVTAAATAGIALGTGGDKHPTLAIWPVVATMAFSIWYLEGRWKMFQHALRDRIRVIEAHFRKDPDILDEYKNPIPFQTYHWWFRAQRYDMPIYAYERSLRPRSFAWRLARSMMQDFVFIPYLPIIVICAISFVLKLPS